MAIYDGDSFFTLTLAGRIGLLALSALLSAAAIWMSWRIGGSRRIPTRVLVALAVLYLFVWLSPQIYYGYYLLIFEGLPLQIVIKSPPDPDEIARLLAFQSGENLSDHSKGVLGWAMILLALIRRRTV